MEEEHTVSFKHILLALAVVVPAVGKVCRRLGPDVAEQVARHADDVAPAAIRAGDDLAEGALHGGDGLARGTLEAGQAGEQVFRHADEAIKTLEDGSLVVEFADELDRAVVKTEPDTLWTRVRRKLAEDARDELRDAVLEEALGQLQGHDGEQVDLSGTWTSLWSEGEDTWKRQSLRSAERGAWSDEATLTLVTGGVSRATYRLSVSERYLTRGRQLLQCRLPLSVDVVRTGPEAPHPSKLLEDAWTDGVCQPVISLTQGELVTGEGDSQRVEHRG